MRIKQPQPFVPGKEYKIGERVTYSGQVLIAQKWVNIPPELIKKYGNMFWPHIPLTQCQACRVKYGECHKIDNPCFAWNRKDKKKIYFSFKSNLK